MAMSLPRISRIRFCDAVVSSSPLNFIDPSAIRPGGYTSRIIDNAVIDLPQPDSPTRPTNSPSSTPKLTSLTAFTRPARVGNVVFRLDISSSRPIYSNRHANRPSRENELFLFDAVLPVRDR